MSQQQKEKSNERNTEIIWLTSIPRNSIAYAFLVVLLSPSSSIKAIDTYFCKRPFHGYVRFKWDDANTWTKLVRLKTELLASFGSSIHTIFVLFYVSSSSSDSSNVHLDAPYFQIILMLASVYRQRHCPAVSFPAQSISRFAVKLLLERVEINQFLWSTGNKSPCIMHFIAYMVPETFNCIKINSWNVCANWNCIRYNNAMHKLQKATATAMLQTCLLARQSEWLCHWLWLPHTINSHSTLVFPSIF